LEDCAPHGHVWQFLRRHLWIDGCFFRSQVINIRPRTLLWFAYPHWLTSDEPGKIAGRVMHITGDDGMFWTHHDARRFETDFGAMGAVVTFCRGVTIRVNVEGVIRAG